MVSQISKFLDFTKTLKSKYLENETFFFQIQKNEFIIHQGLFHGKKKFCDGDNL